MEPLFDANDFKSHEQVLAEYERSESIGDWLRLELGDFFSAEPAQRDEMVDGLLDADEVAFERFIDDEYDEHDLVSLTVAVSNGRDSKTTLAAFKSLPTPISLLVMCCHMCEVGDEVTVHHSFASGSEVTISSQWPFGMHEAVVMTTPNPSELSPNVGGPEDTYTHDHSFDDEDGGVVLASLTLPQVLGAVGAAALGAGMLLGALVMSRRRTRA
jgi:hypothetical protein